MSRRTLAGSALPWSLVTSALTLALAPGCSSDPLLTDADGGDAASSADAFVLGDGGVPSGDASFVDGGPRFDGGPRPDAPVDSDGGCSENPPVAPADPSAGAWEQRFGVPGVGGELGNVSDIAFGPDGAVYAAGEFSRAGYRLTQNIARWTQTDGWRALGEGVAGRVTALAVDGANVLVASSDPFTPEVSRLSRWDGTAWTSLGDTMGGAIQALQAKDGVVVAVGAFTHIGTVEAHQVARIAGTTVTAIGALDGDIGPDAVSIASATDLCVAGQFSTIGGTAATPAQNVACWNGTAWSARSLPEPYFLVNTLTRDTDGTTLIAAGNFMLDSATTTDGGSIARWVTDHWELIGRGVTEFPEAGNAGGIRGVAVVPSGIYVAGSFDFVGGSAALPARNVARWDGTAWHDLGGLFREVGFGIDENVWSVAAAPDGSVYFGGLFTRSGTTRANHIVRWDGQYWSSLRTPGERTDGIAGSVTALARHGSCGDIYVGGNFLFAGDVRAEGVARFDLTAGFQPLGAGLRGGVAALLVGSDGALYAGGDFTDAVDGTSFANLAVFDGASWLGVGTGVVGPVTALALDGANGPDGADQLYVAGPFTEIGGVAAPSLARFDGTTFAAVGPALAAWPEAGEGALPSIYALYYDEPTSSLIVGGSFARAGEVAAANIARWDGTAWHAYGDGLGDAFSSVMSLTMFEGALVAGGSFSASGATDVGAVARFDGTRWSAVAGGLTSSSPPNHYGRQVLTLLPVGRMLFAGGLFSIVDGTPEEQIGVFDGTAWRSLGGGMSDITNALIATNDGVYAGGGFTRAGTEPSIGIALFRYGARSE